MMTIFRLPATVLCVLSLLAACNPDHEPARSAEPTASHADTDNHMMPRSEAPIGAKVFFITPGDGDVVPATFTVEFGVDGMTVAPAGEDLPNSGHHHLLIDTNLPDLALPVPKDENHVHFGDGSTKTERTLAPGTHTLQLLFADHLHIPHDPPVYSERITITVE